MTSPPPLAGPVSIMLPDAEATHLLRSALCSRSEAREALLAWQAGGPRATRRISRRGRLLAPLVAANLADDLSDIDERLITYLRTALVREELRGREYGRITAALTRVFAEADVPFLILGGAALAETAYARPELRHSHGISAMIPGGFRDQAAVLLARSRFRAVEGRDGSRHVLLRSVHESGLPLTLRSGPHFLPHYARYAEDLWARSEERELNGFPTRVLSPADQLWHVCARTAAGEHRATLLWGCDAFGLLARVPDLDWDVLVRHAARTGTSLVVWILLRYVAGRLGGAVPTPALDRLSIAAERADRIAGELALTGAVRRPGPKLLPLLSAAGSWHERAFVMRWALLPSAGTLRGAGRIRSRAHAPLFHAARPFRLVRASARRRLALGRPSALRAIPGSAIPAEGRPARSAAPDDTTPARPAR